MNDAAIPATEAKAMVIIGAGQAGGETAAILRQFGFAGSITVIGEEPYLPYQRPPLSKAFLSGESTVESLVVRSGAAYEKADIAVRINTRAEKIDRHNRKVELAGGEALPYDYLVLATGGRPRMMRVPGAELENIFYLRTIADVDALRAAFIPGRHVTIVGGGYVGLEVAAVAIKAGLKVTVLEGASRVLARVTAPVMSAFYERVHREAGVDIRTGVVVSGFVPAADGKSVGGVECGEGEPIACDLVIIGIGLIPNTEIAEEAGLVVDNGIVVDRDGRTTDPHIFAVGDCAVHASHGFLDRKLRLESVPNGLEQARIVASIIMGKPVPAATAPWFWSDQYKLKLQMVGISDGYDEIVLRGDPEASSFIAFYLKEGRVISADAVNRLGEFMIAKRLVGDRREISASDLADESKTLKSLV